MSEVGGASEADLEREDKVGGGVDGLGGPIVYGSHEHG
jgi:hypothetical protein